MAWTVYGDTWNSGELASTTKFQTFQPEKNIVLKAVRTWIIVDNAPTFTDISMDIYTNHIVSSNNTPNVKIASSTNNWDLADITSDDNAVREIYFIFDDLPLNGETLYNCVVQAATYVPTSSSGLAWKKAWPSAMYTYTPTKENLGIAPYDLHFIGDDF